MDKFEWAKRYFENNPVSDEREFRWAMEEAMDIRPAESMGVLMALRLEGQVVKTQEGDLYWALPSLISDAQRDHCETCGIPWRMVDEVMRKSGDDFDEVLEFCMKNRMIVMEMWRRQTQD